MKKRILALVLSLVMALSLAACGGDSTEEPAESGEEAAQGDAVAAGDPITLTLATTATDDAIDSIVAYKLADKLNELSGGNITADVYTKGGPVNPAAANTRHTVPPVP